MSGMVAGKGVCVCVCVCACACVCVCVCVVCGGGCDGGGDGLEMRKTRGMQRKSRGMHAE